MGKVMTWKEIQKKYPNQWVGLINVAWKDDANVDKADVMYTDKDMTSDELAVLAITGKIDTAVYTTPSNESLSVGALMSI